MNKGTVLQYSILWRNNSIWPLIEGHRSLAMVGHPTSHTGRFSGNLKFLTGFVIQEVKVQTFMNFYDRVYPLKKIYL